MNKEAIIILLKKGKAIMAGYTAIDIINKLIQIEKKGCKMYRDIANIPDISPQIKTLARVLASEEQRHIKLYEKIKKCNKANATPIDFDLYDKASGLIDQKIMPSFENIKELRDLLEFALDFEKQNLALLMSVQGLLVRENIDKESGSYDILTQLIREEEKNIRGIKNFL